MSTKLIIEGGVPLRGKVKISGAKNAAIKEIAASLLTIEPIVLENVPQISDVEVDLEIVKALGVEVNSLGAGALSLQAAPQLQTEIPPALSAKSRAAIVTMGPLLAREGRVTLPTPGGCPIGVRPLDRHLGALEKLGVEFTREGEKIVGRVKRLRGDRIAFLKNTVMGTENVLLAAVLAQGETEIVGAAQEPEVNDLIKLLNAMGAQILRAPEDPRVIRIQGAQTLGGTKHRVLPDRNEVVTFAAAAAVTRGDLLLTDLVVSDLTAFLAKLTKVGVSYEIQERNLRVWAKEATVFAPVEVETAPHPGFMTDWQQPMTLLLTQAAGGSLIHETVYEDRWGYLKELKKFGARIELFTPEELGREFAMKQYGFDWSSDGRRQPKVFARVSGPTALRGAKVEISDLRAGATLVLAALAAEGESEVAGIEHLKRGYENFSEKLDALGAKISRT